MLNRTPKTCRVPEQVAALLQRAVRDRSTIVPYTVCGFSEVVGCIWTVYNAHAHVYIYNLDVNFTALAP